MTRARETRTSELRKLEDDLRPFADDPPEITIASIARLGAWIVAIAATAHRFGREGSRR
jgi:hypothetical protein